MQLCERRDFKCLLEKPGTPPVPIWVNTSTEWGRGGSSSETYRHRLANGQLGPLVEGYNTTQYFRRDETIQPDPYDFSCDIPPPPVTRSGIGPPCRRCGKGH